MKYLNFTKEEQNLFMQQVKDKTKISWRKITECCKIKRSMLYYYLNGECKIPKEKYEQLCRIANIKQKKKEYVEIKNKTQIIKIPTKVNKDIAELVGILAGDGHVSKVNYEVSVSGHMELDKDFISNHVSSLFLKIFKIKPKLKYYKPNNNIRSIVNSKMLVEYLTRKFKLPKGKKKDKLHIPKEIRIEKELLKAYCRGLFDTDGSIYLKRKNSLVISIISKDEVFLNEVRRGLEKLKYKPSVSGKNLYIYNQEQVRKFFSNIKPANEKHRKRYDRFINKIFAQ